MEVPVMQNHPQLNSYWAQPVLATNDNSVLSEIRSHRHYSVALGDDSIILQGGFQGFFGL